MELETKNIANKRSAVAALLVRLLIKKKAKLLVRATECSKEGARALLYELPGVFCVTLRFEDICVRLLKEADQFRIMKKHERSEDSLTILFKDRAALAEVCLQKVPLQKAYAERRVIAVGRYKNFAVFARINSEADKLTLSSGAYLAQYGRRK